MVNDDTLPFDTAHQALMFAFNFSASTLDRPLTSRLADKYRPTGKGLAGLDGAAQAGMILWQLRVLSNLHQAILCARFSPQDEPCPCCQNPKMRDQWMAAVRVISDAAVTSALSGHLTNRALRDGLVARYFGRKVHLQELAARAGVHRDTASSHNRMIVDWLRGTRDMVRKGELVRQGTVGEEQRAMNAAEGVLALM
ncbi:MAG: hypothetical protein WC997_18520 [Porticoccaceae bacterium]